MADHTAEHTVSVTAYFERERDDHLLKAPTTYAILEVKPPIDPGDEHTLRRIVLGDEWALVNIRKLFANAVATVFMGESSLPTQAERHEDIEEIARRLGHMANNPRDALTMMEDRPFPEKKPEPKLEVAPYAPTEKETPPEHPPADEEQQGGITVHLAPVKVPPLAVNVPPLPTLDGANIKPPVDLPSVVLPEVVSPTEQDPPSVFGPPRAGLTRFAPEPARVLPWPPSRGTGKHAREDPAEN